MSVYEVLLDVVMWRNTAEESDGIMPATPKAVK
jgi:hypothetical protein